MPSPPNPAITILDLETLMDAYAYLLATDPRTSNIHWILGEEGMGRPTQVPFGYLTMITESVLWYTNGGEGGLSTGGPQGLDDWIIPIKIVVAFEQHRFIQPVQASPPATSPFNPANNQSFVPPYKEQPGWRQALQINQNIKKVMRTNVTLGGAATDTRVVESRFLLEEINQEVYRVARTLIQTQQRRIRGN